MLKLLGFGELFFGTRAAYKSLFGVLRPFSSEKGYKPPEALAAKPAKLKKFLGSLQWIVRVVKNAQKATKDDEKTD